MLTTPCRETDLYYGLCGLRGQLGLTISDSRGVSTKKDLFIGPHDRVIKQEVSCLKLPGMCERDHNIRTLGLISLYLAL